MTQTNPRSRLLCFIYRVSLYILCFFLLLKIRIEKVQGGTYYVVGKNWWTLNMTKKLGLVVNYREQNIYFYKYIFKQIFVALKTNWKFDDAK